MLFFSLLALFPFSFFQSLVADVPFFQSPVHGIYLTSSSVDNAFGEKLTADLVKAGGNAVVFDIQDSTGRLAYPSNLPISIEIGNRKENQIRNLEETVARLHDQGLTVIARFVLFKDPFLARKKPEWTLKKSGTNQPFFNGEGAIWLDAGNPDLKAYMIDVSKEVAAAGVDEIQFDYVRFPEAGKGGYVGYSYTGDAENSKDQTITNFVSEAADAIHEIGPQVGVDLFGIIVWDNVSWKIIGQNVSELAKHVDAIYPMPYPSHFGPGWGGHKNPADEPYFFVQETTKKFVEQTKDTKVKIRPWLQGFTLRVTKFGPNYIKEQIRALTDIGLNEWVVWNARNDYGATFGALR